MPERELVHQSERRTTKDRNLAAGLQRTTSAQFVELLAAGRVCTDSSGDEGMRKASTALLEQGTQTPSPAPELIPAVTKTSTENLHWDWYTKRGHFRSASSLLLNMNLLRWNNAKPTPGPDTRPASSMVTGAGCRGENPRLRRRQKNVLDIPSYRTDDNLRNPCQEPLFASLKTPERFCHFQSG